MLKKIKNNRKSIKENEEKSQNCTEIHSSKAMRSGVVFTFTFFETLLSFVLFCSSKPTFLDTCSRNESGILISPKRFLFSGIFFSTLRPCFALLVRSCARDNWAMLLHRAPFTLRYTSPPTEGGERKQPEFPLAPIITVPIHPCPSTSMIKANLPNYKLHREGIEKTTKCQSFIILT